MSGKRISSKQHSYDEFKYLALIYFFVRINNCLLTSSYLSSLKYLFMFFAYFSISIPVFLLLICSGSWGSPGSASGKGSTCQCRRHKDAGSVPMSSRSLGTGSGNPLQYSCSKILADLLEQEVATHSNILLFHSRGARPAAVHGSKKSQT